MIAKRHVLSSRSFAMTRSLLAAFGLIGLSGCGNEPPSSPRQSRQALGENVIQNPGFDQADAIADDEGLAPGVWGGEENGGVYRLANAGRHGGDPVAELAGYAPQLFQIFDATPGTTYRVTFWYAGNPRGDDSAVVVLHDWCDNDADDDGDSIDQCPTLAFRALPATSDWQEMSFTVDSGTLSHGRMFILFESDYASGASLLIDDVTIAVEGAATTCECNGTGIDGSPVHSSVCGSTFCGSDRQIWSCSDADYQPTGQACGDDSCTAKYGATSGFQLCFESADECGFEAIKDGVRSCDDVCGAAGGRCVGVHGNDSTDPCTATSDKPDACGIAANYDDICVCSR